MRITDRATQREVIEAMLAEYGIEWRYDDAIPLAEIDKDRSLRNNVRTNPLIPENVDSMVMALKNGADLPPIIVTREGKKYLVWSGNNRTAGHVGAGRKSIPGYVVPSTTPPEVLRMIAVEENRGGTWANSKAERLDHALDLFSTGKFTLKALAQRLDLSESEISAERSLRAGATRADRLGVLKQWERINKGSRGKFEQIGLDEPYKAAIVLAADAGLKNDLVMELVNGIKAITEGVDEQLAYITRKREEWAERIAMVRAGANPDKSKGRTYDVKTAVIMAHGHFGKFPPDQIVDEVMALPDDTRDELIRRITDTANLLARIALKLPQPSGDGESSNGNRSATRTAKKTTARSR